MDPKFDNQAPAFFAKLAETIDAIIRVDYGQQPDLLADVASARLISRGKAMQAVYQKLLDRGVVQVNLGNGLYPTEARARQFGISKEELSKVFLGGVNTDYDRLQTIGSAVKDKLAAGRTVKITAPNGTDLTVRIAGRPVFVSDGVISSEDRYERGPACQVWLPAGEVYMTPATGTAEGTFVADTFFFEGKLIEGLTLAFRGGKLTSMTAKTENAGFKALKERYQAAPAGRDIFAAIDIGINPDIKAPRASRMVTWMGAGTISIGAGGNTWAGGDNDVPFDVFAHLLGGTLTIDGEMIVDRGKLLTK